MPQVICFFSKRITQKFAKEEEFIGQVSDDDLPLQRIPVNGRGGSCVYTKDTLMSL